MDSLEHAKHQHHQHHSHHPHPPHHEHHAHHMHHMHQAHDAVDEAIEGRTDYGVDYVADGEIVLRLDQIMAERGISLGGLAEKIGMTNANLSKIKNNHIAAMRLSTLAALCDVLDCKVGDLIEYVKDGEVKENE